MECQNCELKQRQFYCENCLKQHLNTFRQQISRVSEDRDAHIASSERSLATVVDPARLRRADLRGGEERVQEIWDGLSSLRKANEQTRERIRQLREDLANRRRMLAIASSVPPHTSTTSSPSSGPTGRSIARNRRLSSTSSPQTPSPSSRPPSSIARNAPPSTSPTTGRTMPGAFLSNRIFSTTSTPSPTPSPFQRSSSTPERDLGKQIDEASVQLAALADTIARARSGLVQELVEVFSVVEVGGRPPLGGKAGTKGEWTIGGLVLPVPGDMRRYPPDHINAVLTHTLHFLSLLAFYLGVRLPFEVAWSRSSTPPSEPITLIPPPNLRGNGLLGVGTPWIGATRGGEHGGWARWSTKHPLHVSANPPPSSSSGSSPSSSPGRPARLTTHGRSVSSPIPSSIGRSASLPQNISLEESQLEEVGSTTASGSSFTTALAMLLYNVCYLAHTQAVDVSLAQAGEVLGNLWAVCCSPELGRRSHATQPLLPSPTPVTFPLDFAQLLQATAANPSRARARVGASGGKHISREEKIVEEDDGWDLIDDVDT